MSTSPNPIVVLHGWGHDRTFWSAFAEKFSDRQVFILDLPGFGNKKNVDASWGIPEYSAWVRSRIEEKGLENVSLIGHSFGGRIAAYVASQRPPWLARLILYGAPVLYRPRSFIRFRIRLAKLLKPFVSAGLKRLANAELADADDEGLGTVYRRVVAFDQTELLPLINVPTLLLWGEHDTAVPVRIAREAQTLIGDSKVIIAPGVGHNVHLENPTLFYGLISRFIDAY
ncbi:MAG TPA: alpha/beta hydrolase [Candidatus Paceibacterota bacterium]